MSLREGSKLATPYSDLHMEVRGREASSSGTLLMCFSGAYAEYVAVSTHMLVHKPDHLSWEEAAGIPEVSWST